MGPDGSTHFLPGAIQSEGSIPSRFRSSNRSATQLMASDRKAGTYSATRMRQRWISSSRSATTLPARSARYGLASPLSAHWGIEDPAAVEGTDVEKEASFVEAFKYLRNRISIFISLPIRSLDKMSLAAKLREIGHAEGATGLAKTS